jgi:type VI secretion system VasD/TssJ family lipoprotein
MTPRSRATAAAALALVLAAAGCATMKKVVPGGEPSVKLSAGDTLNLKSDGTSFGALHVRAYLLKDATAFRTLSYDDLWGQRKLDQDAAVLDVQEQLLTPGGAAKIALKPKKGETASAIAVLAGYAQPEGDGGWRQVVDISDKKNAVEITLGPRGMSPAVVK